MAYMTCDNDCSASLHYTALDKAFTWIARPMRNDLGLDGNNGSATFLAVFLTGACFLATAYTTQQSTQRKAEKICVIRESRGQHRLQLPASLNGPSMRY
jgi:hypothetical protein